MPDLSQTAPAAFNCEGGLVLNRSTFMMQPGEALELENFGSMEKNPLTSLYLS